MVEFEVEKIESALRGVAETLEVKAGPCFGVIRIAVSGKKVSLPLFESIVALGKERVLARLGETLEELRAFSA